MKRFFDTTRKYVLFLVVIFYALAIVLSYDAGLVWFYLLVIIYPISIIVASYLHTIYYKFVKYLFIYAPVIFLPILLIYLNKSAYAYLFVYAVCTYVGQFIAVWIKQIRK